MSSYSFSKYWKGGVFSRMPYNNLRLKNLSYNIQEFSGIAIWYSYIMLRDYRRSAEFAQELRERFLNSYELSLLQSLSHCFLGEIDVSKKHLSTLWSNYVSEKNSINTKSQSNIKRRTWKIQELIDVLELPFESLSHSISSEGMINYEQDELEIRFLYLFKLLDDAQFQFDTNQYVETVSILRKIFETELFNELKSSDCFDLDAIVELYLQGIVLAREPEFTAYKDPLFQELKRQFWPTSGENKPWGRVFSKFTAQQIDSMEHADILNYLVANSTTYVEPIYFVQPSLNKDEFFFTALRNNIVKIEFIRDLNHEYEARREWEHDQSNERMEAYAEDIKTSQSDWFDEEFGDDANWARWNVD